MQNHLQRAVGEAPLLALQLSSSVARCVPEQARINGDRAIFFRSGIRRQPTATSMACNTRFRSIPVQAAKEYSAGSPGTALMVRGILILEVQFVSLVLAHPKMTDGINLNY